MKALVRLADCLEIETPQRIVRVGHIRMFHARAVAKWRATIAAANERLGMSGGGWGLWGSPGTVLIGAVVANAVGGALASSNAKAAYKMLGEAADLLAEIQRRGEFITVSDIIGIESPNPAAWQATREGIEFISLGDDFIGARTTDDVEIAIRWSSVGAYRTISSSMSAAAR